MSIRKKTVQGITWAGISQVSKQGFQLIITAILARLLVPSDFGLLGMATVFTGFAAVISEFGISSALIQKQEITEIHLSSSFWVNIIFGILLTLFFILCSPFIAAFYNKPELTLIIKIISFNFLFSSLMVVPQAILTKNLDFKRLMIRDLVSVIISGLFAVLLAFKGYGVWSLVIQSLVFTLVNCFSLWLLTSWRPRAILSWMALKEISKFSIFMVGFNSINYFARNLDFLLIGKFLGDGPLGFYSLAYKLMLVPLQNVSGVITRVIFPVFSKVQNDAKKLILGYLHLLKAVSILAFPVMLGLFVLTDVFVKVVFGDKWIAITPIVKLLCFSGLAQAIGGQLTGNIRLSKGRAGLHFRLGLLHALLTAASIIVALANGIFWIVFTLTLFNVAWSFYTNYITLPLINLKMRKYFSSLKSIFLSSLVMVLSISIVLLFLKQSNIFTLVILIVFGLLVYIFSLVYFKQIVFIEGKPQIAFEND
ncbi:MAG: MOP flippase family protein [Candidatus Omnitrophica bacterium]|nr:MOP flippase family protein [Candidatus Omnitrophota bacterium]